MKNFQKILFILIVFLFCPSASFGSETYGGWDRTFQTSFHNTDLNMDDPKVIMLENEYKNQLFTLLQENKLIESELTIIRIKISGLETPLYSYETTGGLSTLGTRIANTAAILSGKQYWPNACAYAVNEVLRILGIDITSQVNYNPNWVPNYANLGMKIPTMSLLVPGDLVIYDNAVGYGGYDHIGIYAGNGMAYNVSTSNNYRFVLTGIGSRFMEGRRLDFYDSNTSLEPIIIENEENADKIKALKIDEYILKSEQSVNKQKAHMDYIEKSSEFYELKISNITKEHYKLGEDYFKQKELFDLGCIARKVLEETEAKFLETSVNRYSLYKERISFKLINIPWSLNVIESENKSVEENLNKIKPSLAEMTEEQKLELSDIEKNNNTLKVYLEERKSKNNIFSPGESASDFPPLNLGSKETELTILEIQLKEAEKKLQDAQRAHEKAQYLYTLGYIAQKDLEELAGNYEKAMASYEEIHEKVLNYEKSR